MKNSLKKTTYRERPFFVKLSPFLLKYLSPGTQFKKCIHLFLGFHLHQKLVSTIRWYTIATFFLLVCSLFMLQTIVIAIGCPQMLIHYHVNLGEHLAKLFRDIVAFYIPI